MSWDDLCNVGTEELSYWDFSSVDIEPEWGVYDYYKYDSYCGSGDMVFFCDGKLYRVNLNHCSCYGPGGYEPQECLGTPQELFATEGRSIFDEDLGQAIKDKVKELLIEKGLWNEPKE